VIRALAFALLLTACPKGGDRPKPTDPSGSGSQQPIVVTPADAASTELPPAPPLPQVPQSLPEPPANARVTPEAVAFGELLFFDPRLSPEGTRACANCHDPVRGYSGGIDAAADGKPNARRTPSLYNLAWVKQLGWDGRAPSVAAMLPAHMKGQLDAIDAASARIAAVPEYFKHIARIGGTPPDAVVQGLEAYVLTRYEGDTPWDSLERTERVKGGSNAGNPIVAGYTLFTGKAQCARCHTPPLYTDNAFHRVVQGTTGDKGRGLVDPAKTGAFRTPTLRGAMTRGAYFHDGSKQRMDDVIAYYQSPEAAALDPTLGKIKLTPEEQRFLFMFLNMLTTNRPPFQKPALP
jgi:cytochrome c peroxidase